MILQSKSHKACIPVWGEEKNSTTGIFLKIEFILGSEGNPLGL